ncbi:hypothetical protein [Streptomyces sp. NPDC001153]
MGADDTHPRAQPPGGGAVPSRTAFRTVGLRGDEVGYRAFSVNGRKLGHGRPIRVRTGQRVPFHVLNASATEIRSLALPGHTFTVVGLDGNPVPRRASVPVLWIGTAERVSALVEMNHPGVWVLGDLSDDDRNAGMGTAVEYAGRGGSPGGSRRPRSPGPTAPSPVPAPPRGGPTAPSTCWWRSATPPSGDSTSGPSTASRSPWTATGRCWT